MNLHHARILITGASSGIGYATAAHLQSRGANLVITGLEQDRTEAAGKALNLPWLAADLRCDEGIEQVFSWAVEHLEGIDVLINNAGWANVKPLLNIERKDFEDMFSLNVIAPALLSKKAVPYFLRQGRGHIVNVGATGGSYGFQGGSAYGASKAALSQMSRCWAAELRRHNIRVMQIDPSWVTNTNNNNGSYIAPNPSLLSPDDIAHGIVAMLETDDRAFVPQMSVWATNPGK